jgi:fatty acid-binding protein 3
MSEKVDPNVFGKWLLTQSENFDAFMSSLGVGYLTRKLGNQSKPLVTVSAADNNTLSFKQASLVRTTEFSCQLGVPFDETTADGRKVKSLMTLVKPNALKHEMKGTEGGKDSVCVREFFEDTMTCVCNVEDIVTTRTYTRQK